MIDYDPHDWRSHLFTVAGSGARQIVSRVLLCVAFSAVVTAVHLHLVKVDITEKGHALIGVALGLLLVFRTNASYDRFWEARKLWGSIINESRNLGRLACVVLAEAPDLLGRLLTWASIFPHAAMHHLRDGKGLGPAGARLPPDEAAAALKANHVPLHAARRISEVLREARRRGVLSDYVQMTADQNVQLLVDYLGGCERIHRTPMPFAYMVHLRRALTLYCFTLPFALVEAFGWETVVVTAFLTYTLYGIEEIGIEIEDPFGVDENDLPLERFCATIDRDLAELEAAVRADGPSPST